MKKSTKNKKIQIRLDQETYELLQTLSLRFNNTMSETIRKGLFCLAAKNKHYITIGFFDAKTTSKEITNQDEDEESWNDLMKQIEELKK